MASVSLMPRCPRILALLVAAGILGGLNHTAFAQPAAAKKVATQKPASKKAATKKAATKEAVSKKQAAAREAVKREASRAVEQLLRGIFGGRPTVQGVPAKGKKPVGNGDPNARDRIDLLAPQDPRQAKLLRQAHDWLKAGQHAKVLEAVSILLNPPEAARFESDSLFRSAGGRWITVRDEANRLLGGLPEPFRETFRTRFGAEAARRLSEAKSHGGESAMVDVADRFFHTPAGRQAANRLASRHIDRGRLGLAAFWLSRLLEAGDPVAGAAAWRLKAAWVFHRVGQPERVKTLLADLTDAGRLRIPGVGEVGRDEWLGASRPAILPEPVLVDWPVFYGSPARRGRAEGGAPLLLSRWHRRLTHRHAVAAVVRELVEDLDDLGRPMIPAFVPLVVGNKAIFRTLRGIEVVDVDSGRVLWETRPEVAVESLMGGRGRASSSVSRMGGFRMAQMAFPGANVMSFGSVNGAALSHPLTGLLFQHALHGVPSSDGSQVFLIQERLLLRGALPQGRFGGFNPFGGSTAKQPGQWNTLAAFDLTSGRPTWEAGGAKMDEPFDLPLAGTRFLGAPAPKDGRLYVVGEQNNEIRLYVLDAETGQPAWSQRIAYVDAPALANPARRFASSHVAVSDGVAVCPTTVGWLVGVECSSRRILWAHRYARPQPQDPSRPGMPKGFPGGFSPGGPMASAWAAAPPVICGDRVVFTPHAEPVLHCLDLYTGRLLWKKKKGSFLYIAGAFGDRLVLVGSDSVVALELSDGTSAWVHRLAPADGRPAGRGVGTQGRYHLPLSSGQICTLGLADGKVTGRTYLPETAEGTAVLGNLVMSRGLVLALGPDGLTGYEQRESLEARIATSLETDPADGWALLKQSELALLGRDHATALQHLERIEVPKLEPGHVARYHDARRTALRGLVRSGLSADGADVEGWIEQLTGLADSPDRKREVGRLRVERAVARKRWAEAVEGFRQLARDFGTHRVSFADDQATRVRLDRWVSGQLGDLWPKLPATLRAELDKQLQLEATRVIAGDGKAQRHFIEVIGFHRATWPVRFHMAEQAARAGRVGAAEVIWLRLANEAEPAVASRASKALADFRKQRGLAGPARRAVWPRGVEIVRAAGSSRTVRRQDLELNHQKLPWFESHRTVFDSSQQRLIVERVEDGGVIWSVPLPQSGRGGSSNYLPARAVGHQLILYHRGIVQAVSPTTRQMIWSHAVDVAANISVSSRPRQPIMVQGEQAGPQLSLMMQAARRGPLRVVNNRVVCVSGRRRLTALETSTGEVLWQRDRVAAGTPVMGSDEIVYLAGGGPMMGRPPGFSVGFLPGMMGPGGMMSSAGLPAVHPAVALRVRDGKRLKIKGLANKLQGALRLEGTRITWIRNGGSVRLLGLSWTQLFVQQDDVITGKTLWQHKLESDSRLTTLGDDQLVLLESNGRLGRLDLSTGKLSPVGQIATSDLKGASNIYAFQDALNLYVAVNKPLKGSYYSVNMHSIRVNGPLLAFARNASGGPPRWRQRVEGLNLVLEKLEHSPLLLLASRQYMREGNLRYYMLKLHALDKLTGQVRAKLETPSNYWSFNGLRLNLAERYLELGSYNQRIRLVAGSQQRASAKP